MTFHMNINMNNISSSVLCINITNRRGEEGQPCQSPVPMLTVLDLMPSISASHIDHTVQSREITFTQHQPQDTLDEGIILHRVFSLISTVKVHHPELQETQGKIKS